MPARHGVLNDIRGLAWMCATLDQADEVRPLHVHAIEAGYPGAVMAEVPDHLAKDIGLVAGYVAV